MYFSPYTDLFDHYRSRLEKQKEQEMREQICIQAIEATKSETEGQRRYLLQGIDGAYQDHKTKLQEQYGLTDQDPPKTWKELLARIEAGDFQYDGKDPEREHYNAVSHIRWRKKDQKEDTAGYKLAKEKMKKEYLRARDDIVILDLPAALEAKRKFESLH